MKAFKIKNGLQASRYLLSSTTISGSTIDLSLGSMFSTTLSSDPAYTFTNPPASGVAQAFSLEVAGGTTTFTQDSFATTLYAGTSATQTITNGLDLSGDGGLVWIKSRAGNYAQDHSLIDTARGATTALMSSTTGGNSAQEYSFGTGGSFNNNGFTIASTSNQVNTSSADAGPYVAWSFKKQAKFFDIVTYTGDSSSGRMISHNLGSVPGMIIVKRTNGTGTWYVYHGDLGNTKNLYLNGTSAQATDGAWDSQSPTSTQFGVSSGGPINGSGEAFIAYLFAHDTASDSRIQCGSYTGTGADNPVTLGWAPEWLMVKRSNAAASWEIMDTTRGMVSGQLVMLEANSNAAEVNAATANSVGTTSTGFTVGGAGNSSNASGSTYIYMAIRGNASTDSAITWPTSIKWPAGVAPTTPVPGKKDLFTFLTTDGGTTYYGKKAAEGIA